MVRENNPINKPEHEYETGSAGARRTGEYHSADEARQQVEQTRSRMSDTLNVLEEKLAPRRLYDQVADLFRSSGGQSRVLDMFRRDPVPIVLLAAGATWLVIDMMSEQHGTTDVDRPTAGEPVSGSRLESARSRISETASSLGQKVSDAAGSVSEKVSDMAGSIRNKTSETASNLGEQASGMMGSARDRISDVSQAAREKARSWMGSGQGESSSIGQMSGRARQMLSRPSDTFLDLFDRYPLAMTAGALATGIIAGLVLPPTRREEELFGETGSQVIGGVRESGRRVAERTTETITEKVSTVAQAAVNAATEKFHEERKPGESIVDKASQMLTEAKDSALETMHKEGVTPEGLVDTVQNEAERAAREQGLISENKGQQDKSQGKAPESREWKSQERSGRQGRHEPGGQQESGAGGTTEEPLDSPPVSGANAGTGTAGAESNRASVQHESPYTTPGSAGAKQQGQQPKGKHEQDQKKHEPGKAEGFNKSPEGKKKP